MSKLNKIKNGEYIGGDKYIITPESGGKSKVVFTPDSVITEPTPVGAEILNEMQMNGAYTLNTNRIIDGQKEIYVANLEGFTEFSNPDLNLILKINSNNSSNNVYLRLNNIDYQILNCGIGNLISGRFINARKEGNFIRLLLLEKTDLVENDTNKVFTPKGAFDLKSWLVTNYTTLMNNIRDTLTNMINLKLPHGGYSGSGQQLKNEIDTKVSKTGDIMSGTLVAPELVSNRYFKLKDYYTGTLTADMWVNKDQPQFSPNTLYIYNIENLFLGSDLKVYHTGFKPTKADVGLNLVNNWDASSAVNDPSNSKYATIGAVKKAYDKAIEANTNADNKVSKAGDTMTGTLRSIVNNIISYKDTYKGVYASEAAIGFTTASNSWAFFIRDSDNASVSSGEIYANGDQKVYHPSNKPTPADIGALSQKGGTVTGKTRFESNPEVKNSYPGIDFVYTDGTYNSIGMFDGDGLIKVHRGEQKGTVYTTGFKPTPADIGAVKKTGDTMTGDLNVPNITATQYIYLKDYYGTDSKCSIWYNKERASWRPDTVYLGSKDLGFSDGSIALNSRNSGIIKETLFSGTIYKNSPALLTKPITDFDLIYCFSGDNQDMTPSIFLPEDMLRGNGNRGVFQCNYSDTDGCDSNVRIMDLSYFKMESPSSISCAYIYSGDKYIPDAMYADIKVVGIKFGLK